jgi:hypothetical protein
MTIALYPPFGRASQRLVARSQTALIQAARAFPARLAASSYLAFCASLSRNWKTVWGSPLGLPLGRLVSMPHCVITDNP